MASLHLGLLLNVACLGALLSEALQQIQTDGRMGDFTAAEADGNLDLVAALEETAGVADLDVQIVNVDAGGQSDLLDLDNALILAGFLLALGLLKAVLAVIHDAANRGLCLRSDLYKIHALFNCDPQRFLRGNDAQLIAVSADQTDFLVADFFIDLMFHAAN